MGQISDNSDSNDVFAFDPINTVCLFKFGCYTRSDSMRREHDMFLFPTMGTYANFTTTAFLEP